MIGYQKCPRLFTPGPHCALPIFSASALVPYRPSPPAHHGCSRPGYELQPPRWSRPRAPPSWTEVSAAGSASSSRGSGARRCCGAGRRWRPAGTCLGPRSAGCASSCCRSALPEELSARMLRTHLFSNYRMCKVRDNTWPCLAGPPTVTSSSSCA
jgi:hypothetical protein